MWSLGLGVRWQVKEGLGDCELGINLVYGDTMVYECEEAHVLCCFHKLVSDFLLSTGEVLKLMLAIENSRYFYKLRLHHRYCCASIGRRRREDEFGVSVPFREIAGTSRSAMIKI
jgi:hypothetical protein